jgi:hypothetical protein
MTKIFELEEPSIQLFSRLKIKSLHLRFEGALNEELKFDNADNDDTTSAAGSLATAMAHASLKC